MIGVEVVFGLGVDIISTRKVRDAIETAGKPFLDEVYTPQEQWQAKVHPNPLNYLAMIFAAKEAIFKTFAIGWETGVELTEIDIITGESGEPIPLLKGTFRDLVSKRGATKVSLSLSCDNEFALAVAMLV
ncbi:holo-ACP synthase [Chloroflexota bacterium]